MKPTAFASGLNSKISSSLSPERKINFTARRGMANEIDGFNGGKGWKWKKRTISCTHIWGPHQILKSSKIRRDFICEQFFTRCFELTSNTLQKLLVPECIVTYQRTRYGVAPLTFDSCKASVGETYNSCVYFLTQKMCKCHFPACKMHQAYDICIYIYISSNVVLLALHPKRPTSSNSNDDFNV